MLRPLSSTGMNFFTEHRDNHPAGSEDEQRRLSLLAWETVELWGPPEEDIWTRISADWLAGHRWQVVLTYDFIYTHMPSLEEAIRARGHRHVLATQVSASLREPSVVYRLPVDAADMRHFLMDHAGEASVFFTEERDFLIQCDGDESIAYAGPQDFVRAAVQSLLEPDPEDDTFEPFSDVQSISQETFEGMRASLGNSERARFCAAEFERHYRPFLA